MEVIVKKYENNPKKIGRCGESRSPCTEMNMKLKNLILNRKSLFFILTDVLQIIFNKCLRN